MYLTIFDLVLLIILFLFVSFGFALGLVQTIGALIGIIIGAWTAGIYYQPVGQWLGTFMLGNANLANVVAFILVFTLINRLVGLAFYFINKVFNLVSIIPFTKSLNRLLGAVFGLLEGVLALGLILYFASRFEISEWFNGVLAGSQVAAGLVKIASILAPLLPELVRQLKSVI